MNKQERYIYDFFYSLWVLGEVDIIEEYFSQNAILESNLGIFIGANNKKRIVEHLYNAFSMNVKIERVVSYGNSVSVYWNVNALHIGEYVKVLPTHKRFAINGNHFFQLKDSKIVSYRGTNTTVKQAFAREGIELKLPPKHNNYTVLLNAARYIGNIRLDNNEVLVFALKVIGYTEEIISRILNIPYIMAKLILVKIEDKLRIKENEFADKAIAEGTVNIFMEIARTLSCTHLVH